MVKLAALLTCLALQACGARALLVDRACAPPTNGLVNPSFESGAIAPWKYQTIWPKQSSVSVVKPGYNSASAVQLFCDSGPKDPTPNPRLYQVVNICSTKPYKLQWSMVQNKGGTTYDSKHPARPQMFVGVYAPNGAYYELASYGFTPTATAVTVFTTPSQSATHPVSQWVTYSVPLPKVMTGNWTVDITWSAFTSGGSTNTTLKVKLDDWLLEPI